ncbi:MAG: hypothetical protein IJ242_11300 [Clostridia bacterium]|nr:hypothetical protein [Clostridia bacterium]
MSYLKNKTAAFYLMIAAAILSIIGIFFYRTSYVVETHIQIIVCAAVALTVVMAVLAGLKSEPRFLNLCATVNAVILGVALILSASAQMDPLGFWIAGLYTYAQVKGYIFFAVLILIAIIFNLIASFMDLYKKK